MSLRWPRTTVVLAAATAGIGAASAGPTALAQTYVPDVVFLDGDGVQCDDATLQTAYSPNNFGTPASANPPCP